MSKKNNSLTTTVAFFSLTIFLVACSDGGNNSTQPMEQKQVSVTVEAIEDLPNCTETREGEYALVTEDSSTYKCENGKWEFDSAPTPTVETLDDLSNCSAKIEGDTVKVNSESAMFRCEDGKWEKYRVVVDTLMNIDDVLACVAKREGNESYIAGEHALYVCEDGAWQKKVTFMDTTTSQETLPNCTSKLEGDSTYASNENSVFLCIEGSWHYLGAVAPTSDSLPNCTEKYEDGRILVIDEHNTLICKEGKWYSYDIFKDIEKENATESDNSSQSSQNNWEEYNPVSSSSVTPSNLVRSSSSQQVPVYSSTTTPPVSSTSVTSVDVLSGTGDFVSGTGSLSYFTVQKWDELENEAGTVRVITNLTNERVLEFYPLIDCVEIWYLQVRKDIVLTKGYSYQIILDGYDYGKTLEVPIGLQLNESPYTIINEPPYVWTTSTYIWKSTPLDYCGANQTVRLFVNGGFNEGEGFAIHYIKLMKTPITCN